MDNRETDTLFEVPDTLLEEVKNIPVRSEIDELRADIAEVKAILEPLAPFLSALPELMEKIDPLLSGLKDSPVLKMLGVRL